jgi:hypothetical protein
MFDLLAGVPDLIELGEYPEILPDGQGLGQRNIGRRKINPAQDLFAVAAQFETEDPDLAAGRRRYAQEHLDGRGLSGAVGAEDPEDLALVNFEGDSVNRGDAFESLGEVPDFYDGLRHGV